MEDHMIKRSLLVISAIAAVAIASNANVIKGLQDFFAPIVNDASNLPNTIPAGTIVYQNGTSSVGAAGFYGLKPDGTWATMGLATPATHASWSGYHDYDCEWTNTNTSLADFSNDGSCTFTQRTNTGFGTVTSYGSNQPGIVFTPTTIGNYYICANIVNHNNTANSENNFQLWDGTTTITTSFSRQAGSATAIYTNSVCGIYNAASTTSKSIRVRGAVSAGTMYVGNNISANSKTIEWTIYQID